MSWLSSGIHKLGAGIKNVGHTLGKVADNKWVQGATAATLAATGVGAPAAAAILAAQAAGGKLLKPGGNIGQAAQAGLKGAATGALAGGLGGTVRKLGTGMLANGIGGAVHGINGGSLGGMVGRTSTMGADQVGGGSWTDHIIDFDEGGNPIYDTDLDAGAIMGGGGDGGGGFWGGVRKLGSGILNSASHLGGGSAGGTLGNLALGGLAGYQALNAANASKRAGQLSDKAINLAESRWNDAAPLRTAGQARLLNPTRPDLSGVFAGSSNPFATPATPPMAPPPGTMPQGLPIDVGGLIRKLNAAGVSR